MPIELGEKHLMTSVQTGDPISSQSEPVWVWGLPLAPLTLAGTVDRAKALIEARVPSYFITANLNYAMLTSRQERLQAVNEQAAFIVADGMPLVWASRLQKQAVPERVAGSDLIFSLSHLAQERGYRLFLLGGPPGVADAAAENLREAYPGLQVVGTISPPYRDLDERETSLLLEEIRAAQPDILLVALAQPKGELWILDHYRALGIPLCVQLGAAIDFAAKRIRRAPRVLQKTGLEWIYRLWLEPRRLASRYFQNALFFGRMLPRSLRERFRGRAGAKTPA